MSEGPARRVLIYMPSSGNWPRFLLVEICRRPEVAVWPNHVPDVLSVPAAIIGEEYHASSHLEMVSLPGVGELVQFGASGSNFGLFLRVSDGVIVQWNGDAEEVIYVNSSLQAFVSCVREVIERFPFYAREGSDEEVDGAAESIGQLISSIDREAMTDDSFWETFMRDVENGDYATEDVVQF